MSAKSIFTVEDDLSIREVIKLVISEETEYQVFFAEDAETALDILQSAAPDLFLVDYRLPGMNGVALIDRIRAIKAYEQTPIVLMSACQVWRDGLEDIRYLAKPFELDIFLQVVEECLNGT